MGEDTTYLLHDTTHIVAILIILRVFIFRGETKNFLLPKILDLGTAYREQTNKIKNFFSSLIGV